MSKSALPEAVVNVMAALPQDAHPMGAMVAGRGRSVSENKNYIFFCWNILFGQAILVTGSEQHIESKPTSEGKPTGYSQHAPSQ